MDFSCVWNLYLLRPFFCCICVQYCNTILHEQLMYATRKETNGCIIIIVWEIHRCWERIYHDCVSDVLSLGKYTIVVRGFLELQSRTPLNVMQQLYEIHRIVARINNKAMTRITADMTRMNTEDARIMKNVLGQTANLGRNWRMWKDQNEYTRMYLDLYIYIYLKRDKHHSCLLNVY